MAQTPAQYDDDDGRPPPGTWAPAHRAAMRIVTPIQSILAVEAASGILLMVTTVVALVWANSPWASAYEHLWHMPLGLSLGSSVFERSLHFWVNDGLMTIFFLVVGLEIRREIHEGALAGLRLAALPLAAALGGMLVPAGIYIALNDGRAGSAGWGIPMATDIAFAIGTLTLLGSRVPANLRVLLLALAVIDDIGAILVIAIFYSDGVQLASLGVAAAGVGGVIAMQAVAIRAPGLYVLPGLVLWIGLYQAGIHPTLAGVVLGLMTPVVPWRGPSQSARLQHVLHPWVAYGIMPLFALANAGVALGSADISGDSAYVFLGIIAGLALGKPLGIAAFSYAATGSRLASRPEGSTFGGIVLVGMVGGIGFTMSLFVAQLAFPPGPMLDTAKLAILVGSAAAMIGGLVFGRLSLAPRPSPVSAT
ncbi:MAG: Na+/H+ antiporter NhaA [Deltaproteobacteria bacterium]|nr:Na+/H+ antiporter NhaA [Kofleriaceae bacterium]